MNKCKEKRASIDGTKKHNRLTSGELLSNDRRAGGGGGAPRADGGNTGLGETARWGVEAIVGVGGGGGGGAI